MNKYMVFGVILLLLSTSLGCIGEKTREEEIRESKKEVEDHPEIPWWHVEKIGIIGEETLTLIQESVISGTENNNFFITVDDPRLHTPRGYIYSIFDVVHDYLYVHGDESTSIEVGDIVYFLLVDRSYDIEQYEGELNEWREKYG